MWLLKAFLQQAQPVLRDGSRAEVHTQPVRHRAAGTAAPGSVTNDPRVCLLGTGFMLEFKQGEKGSH